MAALTLVGKASTTDWVWDYECDCGLKYRVRAVGGGAHFWPANGAASFSRRFVEAGAPCVKCGQELTLEGCAFRNGENAEPAQRPAARRELRCTSCGYGAIASTMPEQCPMCGEVGWDFAKWRPFSLK
jgi:hypothetical protein